jgi:hypothetical protein
MAKVAYNNSRRKEKNQEEVMVHSTSRLAIALVAFCTRGLILEHKLKSKIGLNK